MVRKKKKLICIVCNNVFESSNWSAKTCSKECLNILQTNTAQEKHRQCYKYYLEHQTEFCRPNYVPRKEFKMEFLKEQDGKCAICGCIPQHNNKPLVFVLDHIDGDASNNLRENLRLICPNCDSQLDTFKSKNKNSTRRNYWKEKIIKNLSK